MSARVARRKRCREKWRGKPCRYSYLVDDGKDGEGKGDGDEGQQEYRPILPLRD